MSQADVREVETGTSKVQSRNGSLDVVIPADPRDGAEIQASDQLKFVWTGDWPLEVYRVDETE